MRGVLRKIKFLTIAAFMSMLGVVGLLTNPVMAQTYSYAEIQARWPQGAKGPSRSDSETCVAFLRQMLEEYYGIGLPASTGNYNTLKAGDGLRYYQGGKGISETYGHTVWVTARSGNMIEVAESNYANQNISNEIHWGRWINLDEISIWNVYSAPYELTKNGGAPAINYGTVTDLGENFYAIISPKSNENLAIHGSATSQNQVRLQNLSDTEYERWHFERIGSGSSAYYRISNDANDFRLSSQGGTNKGTEVKVWQNGTGQDTYYYIYSYNGGYRLVTRPSNGSSKLALDVPSGSMTVNNGIQIWEAETSNNNAQTFTIRKVGGDVEYLDYGTQFDARIVSATKNTLALTGPTSVLSSSKTGDYVTLANKTSGTTSNSDKAQIWTFYKNSDGSYLIKNKLNPTKDVTVANTGYTNEEHVHFWEHGTATTSDSNKNAWFLQKYGNGVRLVPRSAKNLQYSMDILGGINGAKAGSEIIIWEYAGSGCQMTIEKVSTEVAPTGISFSNSSMTLTVGESKSSSVTVSPSNATNKTFTVSSSNTSVATVELKNGVPTISAKKAGTATITARTTNGKTARLQVTVKDAPAAKEPRIMYRTHVQTDGWQSYVSDGAVAGTTGRGLRLEGINIQPNLADTGISGGIKYRTHVQTIGWQDWVSNGQMAGTSGQSLRLEGIQIKLTGDLANKYDVYYRVHAQKFGWMAWAKNGEEAGTAGFAYRLEAIQIKLVKKGSAAPSNDGNWQASAFEQKPTVNYSTHVQHIGWQGYVSDGVMAGTTGQSLRLEAIKMNLSGGSHSGGIKYSTHVQSIGWQSPVMNDSLSGTSGQELRLEAIKIELTGEITKYYDVYYHVHAQKFGWMGWAKNGEAAGTAGYAYRLEGIEVVLVPKGLAAPGDTAGAFQSK